MTITAGNFYEQFGSGLIFRSYVDYDLGYDNSMDGVSIRYSPIKGITLKGIIGTQRYYWTQGAGLVRGLDGEINLNDLLEMSNEQGDMSNEGVKKERKLTTIIGGSVVSKFEADNNNPTYKIPENVAAFAGRIMTNYQKFHFEGEYVYKSQDPYPSIYEDYNYIYRPGQALLLNGSYSEKGLGILVAAKRIDNMYFRSQNTATGNDLLINYLPPLTIQHDYILENFFPYATQANGEMGIQGQVLYNFKKGSGIGGEYGTEIMINYSRIQSLQMKQLSDSSHMGYTSNFFGIGKEVYYQDAGFEITKKINHQFKFVGSFMSFIYNNNVIDGFPDYQGGTIYGNVIVGDLTYKVTDENSFRMELQHMYTEQYKKNWALILLEYTISPKWSFSAFDEYNYNNPIISQRLNYYTGSVRYTKDGKSIQLLYGRRVEGVLCIGGVCRYMPAADGLTVMITCTF